MRAKSSISWAFFIYFSNVCARDWESQRCSVGVLFIGENMNSTISSERMRVFNFEGSDSRGCPKKCLKPPQYIICIMLAIRQSVALLRLLKKNSEQKVKNSPEQKRGSIMRRTNRCDAHEEYHNQYPSSMIIREKNNYSPP